MITISVPVYNEEKFIEEVIKQIYNLKFEKEVLVVDDGSTDNSFLILKNLQKRYPLKIIRHKRNMGKGVAIRTAIKYATGDHLVIQDADFEYEPADLEKVVAVVENKNNVTQKQNFFVSGYRNLKLKLDFRLPYNFFNHILTMLINILYGGNVKDSYSGCKLIPTNFLKNVRLESERFEIEAELIIKLLKKGYRVKQVPIRYNPRQVKEGKKIGILDALRGIYFIIKSKFL